MNFIDVLKSRDLLAQITHEEELVEHLNTGKRTAYIGFDPTADSLHIGHLLQIMTLNRWQKAGHRAIALMGGGTALVGDPSGKTDMRKMLDEKTIEHNIDCFKKQLSPFLDFSDSSKGLILNNADWISPLNYIDLLRDVGRHFSVNRMLTADCFKSRLEKGLSFLEFNYMVLQSYDFLHLNRTEDCTVQLGGNDQWSNILSGMDLVRRLAENRAFCATTKLLETSDGKKMGKTEGGAVWLDPSKTSPFEYFQFWRNVEDQKVGECLKFFTHISLSDIAELEKLEGAAINEAKIILAYEATKFVHGEEEANNAKKSAENLFNSSNAPQGSEPEFDLSKELLSKEPLVIDVLVDLGIFSSKGEVRRLIKQNGLSISNKKVTNPMMTFNEELFESESYLLVKKGKKHFFRINITS